MELINPENKLCIRLQNIMYNTERQKHWKKLKELN